MKGLYSIIVPLYNTEKYIEFCIRSVLMQKYEKWELIIIDDGSTDNSLSIVKQYADKDKRIIVYSQKNAGVSAARNVGLSLAKGEFIMFLDSDDYYDENFLLNISKIKSDFLCCGYNKCFVDRCESVCDDNLNLTSYEEAVINLHTNDCVGGFLPTKVFINKIIRDNNLTFNSNINFCEDLLFVDKYLDYCKTFRYLPFSLYNYRMRKSSVSFNFVNKKNLTILDAYEILINKYSNNLSVVSFLKYKYLFNYFKLKKIAKYNYRNYAERLVKREKNIFSNISISKKEKLSYSLVKFSNFLYRKLKIVKDKKLKLYD